MLNVSIAKSFFKIHVILRSQSEGRIIMLPVFCIVYFYLVNPHVLTDSEPIEVSWYEKVTKHT